MTPVDGIVLSAPQSLTIAARSVPLVVGLVLAVHVLPQLPGVAAAFFCLVLGALIALPKAVGAAVRRGHRLSVVSDTGWFRLLLGGGALRVLVSGALGTFLAALVLFRLSEGGAAIWALALATLPLTLVLLGPARRFVRREMAPLHADQWARGLARWLAVVLLVPVHALLGALGAFREIAPQPTAAASALVGEGFEFMRLAAGFEAFALGQAENFGEWGRPVALVIVLIGQGGLYWALASMAITLSISRAEAHRAFAPASDDDNPPAVRPGAVTAAAVLVLAVLAGTSAADRQLAALGADHRPSTFLRQTAERIGDTIYRPGTYAALNALRAQAVEHDAELVVTLHSALDSGFDAMLANIDPLLDSYYSLTAEYARLFRWATGSLEAHLTAQVQTALQAGDPFAQFDALQTEALATIEARTLELAAQEARLLDANRLEGVNPALLSVQAIYPVLPAPNDALARDLRAAQLRWAGAGGAGVVAALMARRVVAGLARRGAQGIALRGAARAAGLVLAFGADYALLKLDEYRNRDDFHAAVSDEIELLHLRARALLPAPEAFAQR